MYHIIFLSLSPYSFDVSPGILSSSFTDPSSFPVTNDWIPIGAIPLFSTSNHDYENMITKVVVSANLLYQEFLQTDEGRGFCGQICFIGTFDNYVHLWI